MAIVRDIENPVALRDEQTPLLSELSTKDTQRVSSSIRVPDGENTLVVYFDREGIVDLPDKSIVHVYIMYKDPTIKTWTTLWGMMPHGGVYKNKHGVVERYSKLQVPLPRVSGRRIRIYCDALETTQTKVDIGFGKLLEVV